jgi:hypothetical protein
VWPLRKDGPPRRRLQGEKLASPRALDEWVPDLTAEPIRPRQRALGPRESQILRLQVIDWMSKQVIEPCPTPHPLNNNLVFVAKKNGDIRVCDDCTPVNKVTKDYDWPLPRLQDIRHRLAGNRYFSRLDLKDAFFRIGIPAKWRKYTSFTCDGQQYQFKRMPFGLKTAPAVFQQFMDTGLAGLEKWCVWYIDDILVAAKTLGELRRRTRIIKERLRRMGCTVNEEKSVYDQRALLFLGMWIFAEGLGPNVGKVSELMTIPIPTTKAGMQSALGLVSYLRDFIPLVSYFTAKLYEVSDTDGRLSDQSATEEWQRMLRHIASCITTLRHWKEDLDADLYVDASNTGLGVIIFQDGQVVALASRKLTPTEQRYSATDREHLALVFAAKKFKVFLFRVRGQTRVASDHQALLGRDLAKMTPRQVRWASIVGTWITNLAHVPGKQNPADFISRWGLEIFGGAVKL